MSRDPTRLGALTALCRGLSSALLLSLSVITAAAQALRDPMADPDAPASVRAEGHVSAAASEQTGFSLIRGTDGRWRLLHNGRLAAAGDAFGEGRLVRIEESGLSVRTADGVVLLRPHGGITRQWRPSATRTRDGSPAGFTGQPSAGPTVPIRSPAP